MQPGVPGSGHIQIYTDGSPGALFDLARLGRPKFLIGPPNLRRLFAVGREQTTYPAFRRYLRAK